MGATIVVEFQMPVSRRTLLKGSAWVAPTIAAAVALPAQTASTTPAASASAAPDWVGSERALTVQSTISGAPLPAGLYTFTASAGVSPTAELFRTDASIAPYVVAADPGAAHATVLLPKAHAVTTFTAYISSADLPESTPVGATLTVTLPSGSGATISIFELRQAVYGPTGGHWPDRTPRPSDAFAAIIEVAPEWAAIAGAISTAVTQYPNESVKIMVTPGTFKSGNGSGSSDKGVLQNVGATGRSSRILIVPRDGWGTVTAQGTLTDSAKSGYALVGVSGIALMGFDFTEQAVMMRNCRDVAVGWSTFGRLSITANGSADQAGSERVKSVQLVECVLPNAVNDNTDRMALRVADGSLIEGVSLIGCYLAPAYKSAGSTVHVDTLQTSNSPSRPTWYAAHRNLVFRDTIFFQSSNQTLQFENAGPLTFDRTAVIGGQRAFDRYPPDSSRYSSSGENALWGWSPEAATRDSLLLGSINAWAFTDVVATTVSKPPAAGAVIAQGSFTVDPTYASRTRPMGQRWYDEHCPLPTPSRLRRLWADLIPTPS